ncbi:glycosyltransferase family 2 protein [Deinococcus sonorensis]|uniref:Glycosyltransferase family 2 protein n=1 Tax=Deinococcus sonorensis TaxID=309891 RepID=A0ABV8YCQ7_9DEIO
MSQTVLPLISVVIPTYRRPDLLMERSLPSALAQTYPNLEVIVVQDGGPDPETEARLSALADPRVRHVILEGNQGGATARNAGVQAAGGEWIAFLDDDDAWLPHKLERQLALAGRSRFRWPVISSQWFTRTLEGDEPNLHRPLREGEPLGDYLLSRDQPSVRECGLTCSTLLVPRALLLQVPFTDGLPKHQDTDWLLRAGAHPGVGVEVLQEPAILYYFEAGRPQMSWNSRWAYSLEWAEGHYRAGRMSRRAYAGFLVSFVSPLAARTPTLKAFLTIGGRLLRLRPRLFEWPRFLMIWLLPDRLRARLFRRRAASGPETAPT